MNWEPKCVEQNELGTEVCEAATNPLLIERRSTDSLFVIYLFTNLCMLIFL